MSKVAITADIHFGIPKRFDDILWACRTIRDYCQDHDIDTVFVLGDLFHDRTVLAIDVLCKVIDFFKETKEDYGQQWIVLVGNHDMFLRHSWSVNSLVPLQEYITIIDDVKLVKVDDKKFWMIPFITYEQTFMSVYYELNDQVTGDDCLMTHIGVRGAEYNTCFLLKDWSIINFNDNQYESIYTGHFHNNQCVNDNVYYPGSPIPFKFDEGDISHGFYVYDIPTGDHEFVDIWQAGKRYFPDEVAPPQFCTFLDDLIDEKTPDDVQGNIIRVALQKEYTASEKQDILKHFMTLGAQSVRCWDISSVGRKKKREQIITSISHKDLFRSYFDTDNSKASRNINQKLLFKLHDEVAAEGDRLYSLDSEEL